jgi:glycosidase
MGDAAEAMVALTYSIPGMPLIYSGQEYDMDKRLRFFEKDTISKTKGVMWPLLEKLGQLKNESKALNGGKEAAAYNRLQTSMDKQILAFERSKGGEKIVYIANLSEKPADFTLKLENELEPYIGKKDFKKQKNDQYHFGSWEYVILADN